MNNKNKKLKEIGFGFIIIVLICMIAYLLGHGSSNPNCETAGDGTIQCH
jgi:hypothetical protein